MTAPSKKFMFDTDFAGGPRKPVVPMITLAEHNEKRAEAEAAGFRRGYAQAQSDAEVEANRRVAATLEGIAASIAAASVALAAIEQRLECEAVEVAVAVARKLAPTLIAREPFAEIAALASECFHQLIASPHIVVLAEPDIAPGDCRIEWADGGINRDAAATDQAIGEAVNGYISARRNLTGGEARPGAPTPPEMAPAAPRQAEPPKPRASAHELLMTSDDEFRRPQNG